MTHPQAVQTFMSPPHDRWLTTPRPTTQNSSDLVNVRTEAIGANHLPTPEPTWFTEGPLKFKDWQLSFKTLIDEKHLSKMKLFSEDVLGRCGKESCWRILPTWHRNNLETVGKMFWRAIHDWKGLQRLQRNSRQQRSTRVCKLSQELWSSNTPNYTLEVLKYCNKLQKIKLCKNNTLFSDISLHFVYFILLSSVLMAFEVWLYGDKKCQCGDMMVKVEKVSRSFKNKCLQ